MDTIHAQRPEQIQQAIDRQVAEGRLGSHTEFLIEAACRYTENLDFEEEIMTEAVAGVSDAKAGRFATVATP